MDKRIVHSRRVCSCLRRFAGVWLFMAITGCEAPRPAARSVVGAWSAPSAANFAPQPSRSTQDDDALSDDPVGRTKPDGSLPIALIDNAEPVTRDQLVHLLLRSHGPTLLRELVVIRRAEAMARQRRIVLREEDIQRERDAVLAKMLNPWGPDDLQEEDRPRARQLLEAVLLERGSSSEEFQLSVRRQALLRKIAEADIHITDADIDQEYKRIGGERVVVRVIRTATPQQAEAALSEIRRGAPFSEVADRFNMASGGPGPGGLLPPFGREDDRVPALLREAAFTLTVGQVSNPLRIGMWYHILTVERRLPPTDPAAEPRQQVRQRLLRRFGDEAIDRLYAKLMSDEGVSILDPILESAWKQTP